MTTHRPWLTDWHWKVGACRCLIQGGMSQGVLQLAPSQPWSGPSLHGETVPVLHTCANPCTYSPGIPTAFFHQKVIWWNIKTLWALPSTPILKVSVLAHMSSRLGPPTPCLPWVHCG